MDMETIVLLLSALGVGGITPKLAGSVIDRFKGRDEEERNAWKRLDREAAVRRKVQERFHRHRLMCESAHRHKDGSPVTRDDMPPGPDDCE